MTFDFSLPVLDRVVSLGPLEDIERDKFRVEFKKTAPFGEYLILTYLKTEKEVLISLKNRDPDENGSTIVSIVVIETVSVKEVKTLYEFPVIFSGIPEEKTVVFNVTG